MYVKEGLNAEHFVNVTREKKRGRGTTRAPHLELNYSLGCHKAKTSKAIDIQIGSANGTEKHQRRNINRR
ncbi:unnamed protein product, partial [marine sediment metagenome]